MDQPWHFFHGGEEQGPVSVAGLIQLATQDIVGHETLVWTPGQAEWVKLSAVEPLVEALRRLETEPGSKRQRTGNAWAPSLALQREVPGWVAALDDASRLALFECALFRHLADAVRGRPALRDALLTAYVKRHPHAEDNNPANYQFSDKFLLSAVEDFESREEMWEVLGVGNEEAVADLIAAAACLDRRYTSHLQAGALLSRARRCLAAGNGDGDWDDNGEGEGEGLVAVFGGEEGGALAVARDMSTGRTLWHDLVTGRHDALLRRLLPLAQGTAAYARGPAGVAAGQQNGVGSACLPQNGARQGRQELAQEQGRERGGERGQGAQQPPNPLNIPDHSGSTPLHLAVETSQLEVARLLLDAGANPDMQNRVTSKYTSGSWIVRSRDLADFAAPVPSLHQAPLHLAAEAGDLDMLRLLVGRGALLDLRDTSGSTPLHLALGAQDAQAVEVLLAAGANPTLANNDMGEGSTPLHQAASMGSPAILRLLLATGRLGAAVNMAAGEHGWTPLHMAARRGNAECVALLLEQGADPQAATAQGKTPLDIALVNRREVVAALLQQAQQQQQRQPPQQCHT